MCDLLVNDIFDELREENHRLCGQLSFERDLNKILENIKNYSQIVKNNCICSENFEVFKKLNDFEIDYKILKSKQKVFKSEVKPNVCQQLTENDFDINTNTSGIHISNIKSMTKSDVNLHNTNRGSLNGIQFDQICNECHQKFDSELDLVLHVNRNHKNVKSFVCHECKRVFNSEDLFCNHLMEHQTDQTHTEKSPSTVKPKSRAATITDYLRTYRKPNSSDTSEGVDTQSFKSGGSMRLITEMLKSKTSSLHTDNSSSILSINDIKVESNFYNSDEIECQECDKKWKSVEALESHIRLSHPSLVCDKCNKFFYSKDEVLAHLSTSHKIGSKRRLYSCSNCHFKTSSRYSYNRHKQNRICSKGQFKCSNSKCNCSFTRISSLKKHKQTCFYRSKSPIKINSKASSSSAIQTLSELDCDEENGHIVCRICRYKTKIRYHMKEHLISHSGDRPFKCDFSGCDSTYKRKKNLRYHQKNVHKNVSQINQLMELTKNIRTVSKLDFSHESRESQPNEKIVSTSEQEIKLEFISDSDNESILKEDIDSLLGKDHQTDAVTEGRYSCKTCNFVFGRKIYLTLHQIQEHPEMRPYKCEFPKCGKAYTRADSLSKHKHISHNLKMSAKHNSKAISKRKFECNVCHYKTDYGRSLRRHMASHSTEKPFKCDVDGCGYSAKRKDCLKTHQKKVHKMEGRQFICNYQRCRRGFDSQILLRQHMNSHKNRFVCRWEGCQYRTDTFAKLNEHRRTDNHIPQKIS